jgi:hypothetical protein
MKPFSLSIPTMLMRFFLMMILVIIAGFTHQWWIAAIGGAIFIFSLLGYTWKK